MTTAHGTMLGILFLLALFILLLWIVIAPRSFRTFILALTPEQWSDYGPQAFVDFVRSDSWVTYARTLAAFFLGALVVMVTLSLAMR